MSKKRTCKEIAAAINAHLKRFEADRAGINADKPGTGLRPYFWANAHGDKRVWVTYITYQGSTSLTKAQAIRYLEMLDAGFVGRHFEAFRQPRAERGEETK